MVGLAKLFSYSDKILATLFFKLLPEVLRLIVLAIYVLLKKCKHLSVRRRYISIINKKSSKFAYTKKSKPNLEENCSICLSEFEEGDEAREVVDCRHVFHRICLEKWLLGFRHTCPLCRSLVVPEMIVEEYHQMQIEQENDGIEKELALILLKVLHGGSHG
ncbi:hypothetical protein ACS0TY_023140 [Phlomoides rotata]